MKWHEVDTGVHDNDVTSHVGYVDILSRLVELHSTVCNFPKNDQKYVYKTEIETTSKGQRKVRAARKILPGCNVIKQNQVQ